MAKSYSLWIVDFALHLNVHICGHVYRGTCRGERMDAVWRVTVSCVDSADCASVARFGAVCLLTEASLQPNSIITACFVSYSVLYSPRGK